MEPKITIRPYRNKDWDMVLAWWDASAEVPPLPTMMPEESSFIAEIDGVPSLAIALYLTNTRELAYIENFVGNPECRGEARREATRVLLDNLCDFAGRLGFRRLMAIGEKPALKTYYEKIGFTRTLDGAATFIKETKWEQ